MLSGLEILFQLVAETLRWCRLTFRSSRSIKAENLFLRRQLALYIERGVKPQRIDPVTRIGLTLLSRLQALIHRIANENPLWGEERIANEMLLKLGIQVSPRTVSKYLPLRPRGRPRGDLR